MSEEEQWRKRKITNGHKETFGGNGETLYLYWDGSCICQTSLNGTLKMGIFYFM